jgi:signal transduction histidine kinase
MRDTEPATYFLPADRLDQDRIRMIAQEIADSPSAASLALVPLAVAIINNTRQIVYANERFVAMTEAASFEHLAGQRLGEALGCLHASETEGGCGTTRFCQYCGAAKAIVKSLEGEHATQECAISRHAVSSLEALNLQVWTSPMAYKKHTLVLNSILDIAHEKALRGFERIFFHDILNAVSGIKGIHELITMELPASHAKDLDLLRRAIESIEEIVETQKDFQTVEAREYQRQSSRIDSREILYHLAAYCQSFPTGKTRKLVVDPETAVTDFVSDARIIQRILVNMVKNALEASSPGETVTLGCTAGHNGDVTFWVHNPAVMAEETCMRLFEKGFSTKGAGRGFGAYSMRLFASECLAGEVSFQSSPQKGTRFFLTIPRQDDGTTE